MFDSVVIATDGSESVERAVDAALDLADRFDADVHAVYVLDESEVNASPDELREEFQDALRERSEDAFDVVRERTDEPVTTAVREGRPEREICLYAREHDADLIALGTRGRHGEHGFHLGSVAESVARSCSVPILTVRQLETESA